MKTEEQNNTTNGTKDEELHLNVQESTITLPPLEPGKSRFKVQFEFTYPGTIGKGTVGESETEPDMSMRIGQMLERAATAQGNKQPMYFEQMVPVFNDFTDIEHYRDHLKEKLDLTNEQIAKEYNEQKAQKAAEKAAKAAKEAKNSESTESNSAPN